MLNRLGSAAVSVWNRLDNLGSAPLAKTITSIYDLFGGILKGMEFNQLHNFESYLQAGSKRCWALFRCSHLIALAGMDTPWQLQRRGGNGAKISNPEIENLLANPNRFMNGVELIYLTLSHLVLTGNAFWLKDQPNQNNDKPKALFPLNPKRMQLVIEPGVGLVGYIYRPQGTGMGEIPLELDEVMHFKCPHVNNDYWGLGVVESGEDLFQNFINRQEWEKRFWKNGASPTGILVCEDQITNRTKWEEAKAEWQKEYAGVENSGRVAWLTGKWKFEKLGLSKTEMQDVESDKWTVEKIAMQSGVPLSVFGVKEAANFATARTDDLRFRRYSVKPLLTFIAATINSDLIAGFNPNMEMVFKIAGLIDLDALRENFTPLFDRGAVTINELREMAGLAPDRANPLWEENYILSTYVPLPLAGISTPQQTQADAAQARAIVSRHLDRKLLSASGRSDNHDSRSAGAAETNGALLS